MSIVPDRYRDTAEYVRVLGELVRAAQYRGITTYQDIAVMMGLPTKGSHMGAEIGHLLGEISEDEVNAGRPMLSAVAVGVSGKPGSGFYTVAQGLGKLHEGQDEVAFWQRERDAVYETWRRPLSV